MLKLRFSKPSLKQYNDGKISVCKYECAIYDNNSKEILCEFTSTGTAKCSPNDSVDTDFGKKLADSRAKFNAYKAASKLINPSEYIDLLRKILEAGKLMNFVDTVQYLKKKEAEHIKFICEETV